MHCPPLPTPLLHRLRPMTHREKIKQERKVNVNNPKLVVHRIYKRLFSISLTGQR